MPHSFWSAIDWSAAEIQRCPLWEGTITDNHASSVHITAAPEPGSRRPATGNAIAPVASRPHRQYSRDGDALRRRAGSTASFVTRPTDLATRGRLDATCKSTCPSPAPLRSWSLPSKKAGQVAESIEVNVALAATAAGRFSGIRKAIQCILLLGPRGISRYFSYSRIADRAIPRMLALAVGRF
jgi:hypothetical protein